MSDFNDIVIKLEQFIRKYYLNALLKGIILFFAIGLLYMLVVLFVEYMLWLNPTARTVLFWVFVSVELLLLAKFVVLPLAKLFKLQKGIDHEAASKMIGRYFPEVNDKLLNVLQLNQSRHQSELVLASIEQKSLELKPIPFKVAINLRKNTKYLKYAAIPVAILLGSFVFGNFNWFSDSYTRVVHFKTPFEPPAPFTFFVVNEALNTFENQDFKLIVKTVGEVVPENARIQFNGESYFLQKTNATTFEFVFSKPQSPVEFQLEANGIQSKPYELTVLKVPALVNFEMALDYPVHTKKSNEVIKSTGNASVPEGTKITWKVITKSTDSVHLYAKDTLGFSSGQSNVFEASKQVFNHVDYQISTSNENVSNYENLAFRITVIKDEFPELNLQVQTDSIDQQTLYFYGQASDDYGLSKLELVYYPLDDTSHKKTESIAISASNVSQFVSVFPDGLEVEEGRPYELYFQVFDNDAINHFKRAKSSTFTYRKRTDEEETKRRLEQQSQTIQDINNSLNHYKKQEQQLEELTRTQKEKSLLNFNDKKKLESFLKRQEQQDEMMKHFNKKLKDNLEDFQKEHRDKDVFNEDLKKRLEENEAQLKQDEKLLEELRQLQDKINQEDLVEKLEELAKQNKNKKRSLEQLLELTKRYYVEKKFNKLNEDLMKLGEEQEKLSNSAEQDQLKERQEELNKQFDAYKKDLDQLEKDNKGLKKPLDIPRDKLDENEVDKEQDKATEQLQEMAPNPMGEEDQGDQKEKDENLKNAQKSQKKAGQKMKQMSQRMQSSMQSGGGEQMQEDIQMLRQILDNLLLFSFDEEDLMHQFKTIEVNHNKYANYLREQNYLKEHFEHIDDSLFALSLRQPKISEQVNKEITEVYFNMDKALSLLAENQLYQGVSKQQFAVTAANNLADFLSSILDNMQESLSMKPGNGKGEMQLPDIIMGQEELKKMMQEGMKDSEEGQPKNEGERPNGLEENEGDGKNKGEQKDGQKEGGEGQNFSDEFISEKLFEIYQQQQELRKALKERLEKEGQRGVGDRILKDMEEVELDLLNKGFTQRTLQKMMDLQHQLLKLEQATLQQGQEDRRESESNTKTFTNTSTNAIQSAKQYFNTTEILNRQALPLHLEYKKKVKAYFNSVND
ncbi:DUF4175 family protein [Aestuariivivens sediminis]|uniref:DUF4175 family protein n=1 Tax=Aestuariivivens sediminis TaxID=2913557 RepID=UPI001F5874CE|nr:DUF4175 family protein [Aestuariivivens sediminis]